MRLFDLLPRLALLLPLALGAAAVRAEASADALARALAGRDAQALGAALAPALEEHARRATEAWAAYDQHIGTPLRQWAAAEVDPQRGATVFYPFSGPDFPTLYLLHPGASRYVMVAMQPAGAPAALDRMEPARLRATLDQLQQRMAQYARLGFFRTHDLDRDAARAGARIGVTDQMLAFASRLGFEVAEAVPLRLADDGSDVVPHARADATAWRSVRLVLRQGERRVLLDYVSGDLSDGALAAAPAWRAFVERAAGWPTVFKAASHLPQRPQFALLRDAVLARAPSVVQDETGLDYALLGAAYEVALYGRYDRAHRLFPAQINQSLAEAYASRPDVRPLGFRVGYEKRLGSSVQVAVRRDAPDAVALERRVTANLERYAARPRVVYVSRTAAGSAEVRAWMQEVSAQLPAVRGGAPVVSIMLDRTGAVVDASVDRGADRGVGERVRRLSRLPVPPASLMERADRVVLTMNLEPESR